MDTVYSMQYKIIRCSQWEVRHESKPKTHDRIAARLTSLGAFQFSSGRDNELAGSPSPQPSPAGPTGRGSVAGLTLVGRKTVAARLPRSNLSILTRGFSDGSHSV